MSENRRVLITDDVHPCLPQGLRKAGYDITLDPTITLDGVHQVIGNYVGLIINSKIRVDENLLASATELEFIGRLGSGMEIIDVDAANRHGVAVFNSPSGNCQAVAEHALGMLLGLMNHLPQGDREVREYIWRREANRGRELQGLTVGIVGFGHTGSHFAQVLRGFDVKIVAYDKYNSIFNKNFEYVQSVPMEQLFKDADVISLHLPMTAETNGLVDKTWLQHVKRGAILINTSRGKIVDTQALINALNTNQLSGAALDVLEHEKPTTLAGNTKRRLDQLFGMSNVIVTPHVAGWTVKSKERLARIILSKILGSQGFNG